MDDAFDALPELAALIDAEAFREVCKSYSELYGVGVKAFDAQGRKIVDIRANNGQHCGYLFSVHPTRVLCTNLVQDIKTRRLTPGDAPSTVDCFSGLRYKIMPIVFDGELLGRLIFGPFAPPELQAPPPELAQYEPDLRLDRLAQYLQPIAKVPEPTAHKILDNMQQVLDVIIHASYKVALTSRLHIGAMSDAFNTLEKTNSSLREANLRLQDLDRVKSNFVATVSHELRTPLTSVIGYSELLLEGLAGEITTEQRQYIGTILEKGESLLHLIGQILDLARLESGQPDLIREPLDPRRAIELAVSDVAPQAQKRQLNIIVQVAADVDPIIADADKVRRILTNLLGNAIKFTLPGGRITVRASIRSGIAVGDTGPDLFEPERNRQLVFTVEDTGIGIPKDKLERVFDSFFQAHNDSKREFGGSGLGLSIVRNFVAAHSGSVSVQSQEGVGTTFTVCLPYVAEPLESLSPAGIDGLAAGGPHPVKS